MKVHDVVVKGYSITGHVYVEELPLRLALLFPDGTEVVGVDAEFSIEWDDDIANVVVDKVYLTGLGDEVLNVDIEDLENEIQEYGNHGDWEADRIASMADHDYDLDR